MKSPYNRGDRAPTEHLLSPNKDPKIRNELYLIELLVKGAPWIPNKPGCCQDYMLLSSN